MWPWPLFNQDSKFHACILGRLSDRLDQQSGWADAVGPLRYDDTVRAPRVPSRVSGNAVAMLRGSPRQSTTFAHVYPRSFASDLRRILTRAVDCFVCGCGWSQHVPNNKKDIFGLSQSYFIVQPSSLTFLQVEVSGRRRRGKEFGLVWSLWCDLRRKNPVT